MKKISFIITIFVLTLCLSSTPVFSGTFKIGDADFKLGGKVQYNVGYEFHDLGDVADGVEDSKTNIFSEVPGTSRFYIGANYDNVEGYFEIGAGTSSVAVRHAYLQYDLGGGNKLMAGQYWSLVGFHFPALRFWADDALIGFGKLYTGRNPQLRFTHQADNLAFKVSIEDVKLFSPVGLPGADYTVNEILPALMVSLDIIGDNYVITPNAMIQQYELTGNEGFDDIDILAWALVLDGVIKSGKIAFDYEAWYGQNVGVSASLLDRRGGLNGRTSSYRFGVPPLNGAGDDVEDVSAYGGFVQLTAPVAQAVMHLGGGYQQSDTELGAGFEDDVTTMAAFVNFDFNLAKGFIVSPEVVYLDNGDDANKTTGDLGSSLLVGVHFEYNF